MRQFMMKNADGQTFDLMRKDAFLSEPAGLGFGQDVELTQAGTGWVLTKISYTRPEPSGQMVFAGYDQYEEFLQFLGAGGTELWYKPLSVWLCLPCAVTLDKGEIGTNRRLCCSITFQGLGPWAEQTMFVQAGLEAYGFGYPRHYPYSYGQGSPGLIRIRNGNRESPFRLNLFGPAKNPAWTLRQYGTVLGTGRILTELQDGRKLVVDSDPSKMEITEYTTDNEFVASRYDCSDFATERILLLPPGECTLYLLDDNGVITGTAEVAKLV